MRETRLSVWGKVLCGAVFTVCAALGMKAQSPVSVNDISAEMQALAGHAATIFVGQIVSVEREGSIVEVRFRVEQPLRGSVGSTFTMREWAGLWPAGHLRYTVGARVLALVNGTSAAGLSSPVHGAEGLIPVVVQGANAPQLLDVRRVAASVVRAPGTSLPTEANGAVSLSDALRWMGAQGNGNGSGRGLLPVPTRGRKPLLEPVSGPAEPVEAPTAGGSGVQDGPIEGLQGPRALPILEQGSHDLR